jgi:hypothetical protein
LLRQIVLLVMLVACSQCSRRVERPTTWLGRVTCNFYTCFCHTCAASDVQEEVEPGSWWNFCCCLNVLYCCVPCGWLCANHYVWKSREALAAKYGVVEDPVGRCCDTWCESWCWTCMTCYLNQELYVSKRTTPARPTTTPPQKTNPNPNPTPPKP